MIPHAFPPVVVERGFDILFLELGDCAGLVWVLARLFLGQEPASAETTYVIPFGSTAPPSKLLCPTALALFRHRLHWHRVHRRLESNKQNARAAAGARSLVRQFSRSICVHAGLENRLWLPLVRHVQLPCDEDHPLRGRVPVLPYHSLRRYLEEYIGVLLRWVAVENRDATARGQKWGAGQ